MPRLGIRCGDVGSGAVMPGMSMSGHTVTTLSESGAGRNERLSRPGSWSTSSMATIPARKRPAMTPAAMRPEARQPLVCSPRQRKVAGSRSARDLRPWGRLAVESRGGRGGFPFTYCPFHRPAPNPPDTATPQQHLERVRHIRIRL